MKIKELEAAFTAASLAAGHADNTLATYLPTVMEFARMLHAGKITGPQGYFDYLSVEKKLAGDSVRHALNPLKFLYEKVLGKEFGQYSVPRRDKNRRMPQHLAYHDVMRILGQLTRISQLQAGLLVGCGLRMESDLLRIRLKDLQLSTGMLLIQEGKGDKSRAVQLPRALMPSLEIQIRACKRQWAKDSAAGVICPPLRGSLQRKYGRRTFGTLPWYFLFPSRVVHRTPDGPERWHSTDRRLARELKEVAEDLGIMQRVHPHALRHTYATTLLQSGVDIRTIQYQLGHADVKTTEIYTHIVGQRGTASPLDRPDPTTVVAGHVIPFPRPRSA